MRIPFFFLRQDLRCMKHVMPVYESTLLRGCYFLEQPQAGVGSYKVRGSRSAHCCSTASQRYGVARHASLGRPPSAAPDSRSQPSESRKKVLPPPGTAARRRQTEAGERQDPNCASAGGAAATSAGAGGYQKGPSAGEAGSGSITREAPARRT